MKLISDFSSTLRFYTNAGYNSVSNKNLAIKNIGNKVTITLVSTAEVGALSKWMYFHTYILENNNNVKVYEQRASLSANIKLAIFGHMIQVGD